MGTGNALCALLLAAGLAALGCASTTTTTNLEEAERQLQEKEREVSALEQTVRSRESELEASQAEVTRLHQELESTSVAAVSAPPPRGGAVSSGAELLPPAANPGECFARVFMPQTYETDELRVLRKAAGERIETVPARYEWVEERVIVKEASSRIEEVPAVYITETERVLVRPAETVWKRGRGPIERIDDATGEIMCLVEIPAEYKTVQKRVLSQPATTRTLEVPAEYKTVKVRKLVEPARERRIPIPAEYQTVSKRRLVTEGRMAWRPVLCQTNATRDTVTSIQRALQGAGHDPGPIDGLIGRQTLSAVESYQQAKGLPTGGLTYATIDTLGVKVGR